MRLDVTYYFQNQTFSTFWVDVDPASLASLRTSFSKKMIQRFPMLEGLERITIQYKPVPFSQFWFDKTVELKYHGMLIRDEVVDIDDAIIMLGKEVRSTAALADYFKWTNHYPQNRSIFTRDCEAVWVAWDLRQSYAIIPFCDYVQRTEAFPEWVKADVLKIKNQTYESSSTDAALNEEANHHSHDQSSISKEEA